MKRLFIMLFVFTFVLLPSTVMAGDFYIGGKAGVSFISAESTLNYQGEHEYSDDYNTFDLGIMLGGTFAEFGAVNLRFEIENLARFGSGEMEEKDWGEELKVKFNNSLLGSLYFDFPVTETIAPYAGPVIGMNIFSYEAKSRVVGGWIKETGTGVAFQYGLSGGVAFKMNEKWALDLNARYLWSTKYNIDYEDFNTDFDIDLEQSMADVTVGFRYYF